MDRDVRAVDQDTDGRDRDLPGGNRGQPRLQAGQAVADLGIVLDELVRVDDVEGGQVAGAVGSQQVQYRLLFLRGSDGHRTAPQLVFPFMIVTSFRSTPGNRASRENDRAYQPAT